MNSNPILTLATKDDAVELFPFWSDDRVARFTMIRNMKSPEDCERRIVKQMENVKTRGGRGPFSVRLSGKVIGYCGATAVEGRADEYEIFYNLGREYWGRGYGTQIAKGLLDQLFAEQGAKRVVASAVVENPASWRILEKIGMLRVGTQAGAFGNGSGTFDLYHYAIEKRE